MEARAAEVALRESEELHRITLLSMSDAVFITADDGRFTFVCPNADVIFGYTSDEVREMGQISALFGGDLIAPEQVKRDSEIQNIEHEVLTKGGTKRALLVHVKSVSIKGGTLLYVCRDVSERKRAEEQLRRNEERLKLALEAATAGTWDWDHPTGDMEWSPETHRLFGDTIDRSPTFNAFLARVHPADRERVARTMTDAMNRGASYEIEFRAVGYDDVERWVMGKGKALRNGKPIRMLGVFVDLTERHFAELELLELSGRLIDAHEQERLRLSRDLHDDVSQRMALVSAQLGQLQRRFTAVEVQEEIRRLAAEVNDIGAELHRFSHELHPARLRQLGVEQSIRIFCQELTDARDIVVDVQIDSLLGELTPDAALCLYRIAQEALQNVVKHSGAPRATLRLTTEQREVVLTIADDGAGFDPAAVRRKETLGLLSMRERARLVNGHLIVSSEVSGGTLVELRVPVGSGSPDL